MKAIQLMFCLFLLFVTLQPVKAANMRIHLKTHNGKYLQAVNGGGGEVLAKGDEPRQWETFTLIDINGGKDLISGEEVYIRAYDRKHYLCAEQGGGDKVVADRTQPKNWETFIIQKMNGGGAIRYHDPVAFKAINGNYMVAENGSAAEVNANRTSAGSWETFILYQHPTFHYDMDDVILASELISDSDDLVNQYSKDLDLVHGDGTWNNQGLNNPYDVSRPFGRVMTAAHLMFKAVDQYYDEHLEIMDKLEVTRTDFRTNRSSYLPKDDFFYQIYDFVRRNTRHVKFSYADDVSATTNYGFWPFVQENIELKVPFFWNNAVERAGTIIHEARHLCNTTRHNCDSCPNGASCDSKWEYNGANTFAATYYLMFYKKAQFATTALKNSALSNAIWITENRFCEPGAKGSLFRLFLNSNP